VVSNAVFHLPRKANYTWLPWCTYTDPPLASIGMNEKAAKAAGIDCDAWTEEFHGNDRSLAEGEDIGKIKMLPDKKEKPIGVQILGPQAGDLLAECARDSNSFFSSKAEPARWRNSGGTLGAPGSDSGRLSP